MDKTTLLQHRNEALSVFEDIYKKDNGSSQSGRPGYRRHPLRYISLILADISGQPAPEWCSLNSYTYSHAIRQIHDGYGWVAINGKKYGKCAGALYRTAEFMRLPTEKRNGCRNPSLRNIHIEHTVPVSILQKLLKFEWERHRMTEQQLLQLLMNNSICVAMSYEEQKAMDRVGVEKSTSPAYQINGSRNVDTPHPFLRYKPLADKDAGFKIFNVVTEQEVEIHDYTFRDHEETLRMASEEASGHLRSNQI